MCAFMAQASIDSLQSGHETNSLADAVESAAAVLHDGAILLSNWFELVLHRKFLIDSFVRSSAAVRDSPTP